jgi:hypothetical protein
MKQHRPIDVELVRSLFDYVEGFLVRRSTGRVYDRPHAHGGYTVVQFGGHKYYAHRLIWAIHYDDPGELEVDHINHDVRDSRIENLRIVTHQENMMNKSSYEQQSGHCGVHWDGQKSRWRACLTVDGKTKWLGRYKDKGKAIEARKEAEKRFGYHENHGVKK